MACTQTLAGILQDCETTMGGIVEAYIANYSDVNITPPSPDDDYAGISVSGDGFQKYQMRRGVSSMTSTLNADPANGVNYVTTEVVLTFAKMTLVKRDEIAKLAVGQLCVVVKDANGKYWLLGAEHPVMASAGTGQTGTAIGDANNYQITLQDNSSTFPYEVNSSDLNIE